MKNGVLTYKNSGICSDIYRFIFFLPSYSILIATPNCKLFENSTKGKTSLCSLKIYFCFVLEIRSLANNLTFTIFHAIQILTLGTIFLYHNLFYLQKQYIQTWKKVPGKKPRTCESVIHFQAALQKYSCILNYTLKSLLSFKENLFHLDLQRY